MSIALSADAYVALTRWRRLDAPLFVNRSDAQGPDLTNVPVPGPETVSYAAWASFAEIGELTTAGLVRHEAAAGGNAVALTLAGRTADVEVRSDGFGCPIILDDVDEVLMGPAGRWEVSAETRRKIEALDQLFLMGGA